MPGTFGTPAEPTGLTIEQCFAEACRNGYMQQLQAYGVGRGLSPDEAYKIAIEQLAGEPLYLQEGERYQRYIEESTKRIDSARLKAEKELYLRQAVSTGDNNVKEDTPASSESEVQKWNFTHS